MVVAKHIPMRRELKVYEPSSDLWPGPSRKAHPDEKGTERGLGGGLEIDVGPVAKHIPMRRELKVYSEKIQIRF